MGFTPTESIWFNGRLVPWGDAKTHVLAHGLQYGTGVFEGMKSYPTADGPAIFRLDAHLERFFKSAELYDLVIPYPLTTLADASLEVVRANHLEAAYLRPVAFCDAGTLIVWTSECPITVAIAAVPTGKYLANADEGARVTISPIRKFDNGAIPAWAPYDLERRPTMVFDVDTRSVDDPRAEERKLFQVAPFLKQGT